MNKEEFLAKLIPVEEDNYASEKKAFLSKLKPVPKSVGQKTKDVIRQAGIGALEGTGGYGDIASLVGIPTKSGVTPGQKAVYQAEQQIDPRLAPLLQEEEVVPSRLGTSSAIRTLLQDLGMFKEPEGAVEKGAQRFGRILGSGAQFGQFNPFTAAAGAVPGQIAEEAGAGPMGQALAEIAGMAGPDLVKAATKIKKAPPSKFSSGLEKPLASESKLAQYAKVPKEHQERVLDRLFEQGKKITGDIIHDTHPSLAKIEQGFPFEKHFEQAFGELEKAAHGANPKIDVKPIEGLMKSMRDKFSGIRAPHSDAKSILKDAESYLYKKVKKITPDGKEKVIKVFMPSSDMSDLYKIYRSNNQKLKNIYEKSRLLGSQKEYADFLVDFNKKIAESFEKTLPEDSKWMQSFKDLNKQYGSYRNAQKTSFQLKDILGEEPKPASFIKIATNPKTQQKLALSMGKEGAEKMIGLAKDMKSATEAIKSIPTSKLDEMDKVFPLVYLIPGVGKLKGLYSALKVKKLGQYGMGYLLSQPERAIHFQEALQAIATGNVGQYAAAVAKLKQSEKE